MKINHLIFTSVAKVPSEDEIVRKIDEIFGSQIGWKVLISERW